MEFWDILTMIGGLCLFLFGMSVMGDALERRAGSSLRTLLSRLTSNRMLGFLTGLAVTAVIQSSSATTVMVVGFVNSGLLTLRQAIGVIMGANVGTTVTAWILSLGGIEGDTFLLQMLKPTNFTPILALVGIILYMFMKDSKKKDTGMIFLGFAVLMFGMDTMSGAVKGLKDEIWFQALFLLFKNPILGVVAGAVLTAIIQSSSASVGILQALSATGQVSYAATIPIIMGQNIGTCITAILSSFGTNKNAKRAAFVHLLFNIIGTTICLILFVLADWLFSPAILGESATYLGISICHTAFNIICTAILLPSGSLLEKLVCKLVPDAKEAETVVELDERLLATPPIALERCRSLTAEMAQDVAVTLKKGIASLSSLNDELAAQIRKGEDQADHYEDILGTYLVKLSALQISTDDSAEAAMLLKAIGDLERISDHSVNLLEAAEELKQKDLRFSDAAQKELDVLMAAVSEVLDLSIAAFLHNDWRLAQKVEPLEDVIDDLKDQMRARHILRLQQGSCSIEIGFVWTDLLTSLARTSDHCSNIAAGLIDLHGHHLNTHQTIRSARTGSTEFQTLYQDYSRQFRLS
ncbi:MAG: Na/Pi cotransporter family protein [Oscillospiraceae bacterium]|nr:Na/Pi cotransporter family protein [Oscillospiraceae bacterium]